MSISPFKFSDYKRYIEAQIAAASQPHGMVSVLAEAAGCKRSYLSQVLNSHLHLTPDHAVSLAVYWSLPRPQAKYFCLLVDLARASTNLLKSAIREEMESIVNSEANLEKRLAAPKLEPGERELRYYSAWYYSAVHVIVSIPALQTADAISDRLGLPRAFVQEVLEELQKIGLIKKDGKRWVLSTGDIHVPKKSLLSSINHANWRERAVMSSRLDDESTVHYTSVASMSREDYVSLKEQILEFIDKSRKVITASKEEELICTTIDFFKV